MSSAHCAVGVATQPSVCLISSFLVPWTSLTRETHIPLTDIEPLDAVALGSSANAITAVLQCQGRHDPDSG